MKTLEGNLLASCLQALLVASALVMCTAAAEADPAMQHRTATTAFAWLINMLCTEAKALVEDLTRSLLQIWRSPMTATLRVNNKFDGGIHHAHARVGPKVFIPTPPPFLIKELGTKSRIPDATDP